MDKVSQIVIAPPPPRKSVRLFAKKERPDLVLIVYDTNRIEILNVAHQHERYGTRPMYVPAKYALAYEEEWTDSSIFCQVHATVDEYLSRAIWFNDWRDLPVAVNQLRARFPDKNLPEQVDYVLDWPEWLDRRTKNNPGDSIVVPLPPKVTPQNMDD